MKLDAALAQWSQPGNVGATLSCLGVQVALVDFRSGESILYSVPVYVALVRESEVIADRRFELVMGEVGQRIDALWEREDWFFVRR